MTGRVRRPGPVLIAVLVAVASASVASYLTQARRYARHQLAFAASRTEATVQADVDRELAALAAATAQAGAVSQLVVILQNDLDATTLADALATEPWWQPWRIHDATLLRDGKPLVGEGGLPPRGRAAGVGVVPGPGGLRLVAAVRVETRADRPVFHLVLGRALDERLLERLALSSGAALQLSDGRTPGMGAGAIEGRAAASAFVGREGEGVHIDVDQGGVAVPVRLAAGRWVWAYREVRVARAPVAAIFLGWGIAALAAGVAIARRLRRQPAPIIPAAPRPSSALAAQSTIIAPSSGGAFGRYAIIERIGMGGMAEIYVAALAGAAGFQRLLVLKRLRPEIAGNPEAVHQFIDEAKLGSMLVHSNIVPVFDFGQVGGGYFTAQEYIEGRNLAELMERHNERVGQPLAPSLALYIAHEVAEALAYAHEKTGREGEPLGIVHRDVSTSNVMITLAGEVKLIDFGIVKASNRVARTEIGQVKGNAVFMSPEQARGQPVDARSDLFSLGVVLFQAVTGTTLYTSTTTAAAFYEATCGPTAAHLGRVRALPPPTSALLERALALDAAGRFPSARDFAEALAPHAAGGKPALATLMNALFGEELHCHTATLHARLEEACARAGNG